MIINWIKDWLQNTLLPLLNTTLTSNQSQETKLGTIYTGVTGTNTRLDTLNLAQNTVIARLQSILTSVQATELHTYRMRWRRGFKATVWQAVTINLNAVRITTGSGALTSVAMLAPIANLSTAAARDQLLAELNSSLGADAKITAVLVGGMYHFHIWNVSERVTGIALMNGALVVTNFAITASSSAFDTP